MNDTPHDEIDALLREAMPQRVPPRPIGNLAARAVAVAAQRRRAREAELAWRRTRSRVHAAATAAALALLALPLAAGWNPVRSAVQALRTSSDGAAATSADGQATDASSGASPLTSEGSLLTSVESLSDGPALWTLAAGAGAIAVVATTTGRRDALVPLRA